MQVDVEIATMTFNFWYNLSDVIYDATTKLPSEFDQQVQAGVAKELIQEQIKSGFRPYFGELFKALLQHVKCDTTLAGPLSSDSTNADLRERVTDLMAETSFIVGAEGLLGLFWVRWLAVLVPMFVYVLDSRVSFVVICICLFAVCAAIALRS